MSGVYPCGGKQNAPENQETMDKFKELAVKVSQGVGAATLIAGGIKLSEVALGLWNQVVAASSPLDDELTKGFTAGTMGTAALGMAAGVAIAAAGAYAAYKLAKDNNLKAGFLQAAAKVKNSKLGQRLDKFATPLKNQFAKGMDVNVGTDYRYTILDKNGKPVRQFPKVLSNYWKKKLGGRQ